MFKQIFYSVSSLLILFGILGCTKPVNNYTVKIEAIGKDAKVNHVNITYYNPKGEKTVDHSDPNEPKFETTIKSLKGKPLVVKGEAELPGTHDDHDDDHGHGHTQAQTQTSQTQQTSHDEHKEVKVKISILRDGKVVKEETTESEKGIASGKVEINE